MSTSPHTLPFRAAPLLLLAALLPFVACGSSTPGSLPTASQATLTGNWQIQSAVVPSGGTIVTPGLLLLGELTSSGANLTGTFRFGNLALPNTCNTIPLLQVVTVSGAVDASGNLALTSDPFSGSVISVHLLVPTIPANFAAGTIAVTGGTCAFPSSSAIGSEFASVTGTYTGTVTASASVPVPPIASGTASLAIIQSTTPNLDGQFPVSGTVNFAGGGCTSSVPVSGTVSGVGLTLDSAPTGLTNFSADHISAVSTPTATQLTVGDLLYGSGPCNAGLLSFGSYSGTLLRQ